jgi:hypothetical protein
LIARHAKPRVFQLYTTDKGGTHFIHDLIKPGEIELTILRFVAVSSKVAKPNNTETRPLHHVNVTFPCLGVRIVRMIVCADKQTVCAFILAKTIVGIL